MLGMSQVVVTEIGNVVQSWLKNPFNKSFFFWFFLPSAGFIYLQLNLINPFFGFQASSKAINAVALQTGTDASSVENLVMLVLRTLEQNVIGLILIPFVLAIILSALSGIVLRLFQGSLPGVRWLLRPLLLRNRDRSINLYQNLRRLRDEYFFLVSAGLGNIVENGEKKLVKLSDEDVREALNELQGQLQQQHELIEAKSEGTILPVLIERVAPTALGNVLAKTEEYPFERYGMDAKVFWPRLRAEIEPEKIEPLDANFGAVCGLLNIALLAILFVLEVFVSALYSFFQGSSTSLLWPYGVLGLLIALGSYRAAVSVAVTLGNNFRLYFDYYRGRILEKFGLRRPASIEEERLLWLRLGTFLRRGEAFYFPSEWNKSQG